MTYEEEYSSMQIAIGSDHAGFTLKEYLVDLLREKGISYVDFGGHSGEVRVDYPEVAFKVAGAVASGKCDRGILVCGSGIGMAIAANKVKGVYAARCNDTYSARMSRKHNNANVLTLGGRMIGRDIAAEILDVWLETAFEGGRHEKRVGLIRNFESDGKTVSDDNHDGRVVIVDHPLVQHKVGIIRDKDTSVKEFRELVQEIAGLMVYDITRFLPLAETEVETPIQRTRVRSIQGKKLAVVPVLRAGLGMVEGILRLIPNAKVGHVGLYRDPETLQPVEYYCKLPNDIEDREIFIVDPMLATGGSAVAAIDLVKRKGARKISLVNLIGAPEGVAKVHESHPEVDIFLAALDEKLNDHGYIVPGLGDAGDRLFGTR